MSINSVAISGNLGSDPELRATKSGMQVLSFSVCANSRVKRGDSWEDKPNWVEVSIFGRRAEAVAKYLAKGTHVTLHGRLSQSTWETKDGQKRSRLEVIADDIDFSGGARSDSAPAAEPAQDYYDEDIPF
jgi:single-strand DNA-binding protein